MNPFVVLGIIIQKKHRIVKMFHEQIFHVMKYKKLRTNRVDLCVTVYAHDIRGR